MKIGKGINIGKVVKGGLRNTGDPSTQVKKAKGKGKATPQSIVRNISGKKVRWNFTALYWRKALKYQPPISKMSQRKEESLRLELIMQRESHKKRGVFYENNHCFKP